MTWRAAGKKEKIEGKSCEETKTEREEGKKRFLVSYLKRDKLKGEEGERQKRGKRNLNRKCKN